MKKKLRDCSQEELRECCRKANTCSSCKLNVPNNGCFSCLKYVDKTYLSDKALNIELDIPAKEILDKEDKETLIYHCLLLKREHCEPLTIAKHSAITGKYFIYFWYKAKHNTCKKNMLVLPTFVKNTMFANMEIDKEYTLQELDIDLDKYELALNEN